MSTSALLLHGTLVDPYLGADIIEADRELQTSFIVDSDWCHLWRAVRKSNSTPLDNHRGASSFLNAEHVDWDRGTFRLQAYDYGHERHAAFTTLIEDGNYLFLREGVLSVGEVRRFYEASGQGGGRVNFLILIHGSSGAQAHYEQAYSADPGLAALDVKQVHVVLGRQVEFPEEWYYLVRLLINFACSSMLAQALASSFTLRRSMVHFSRARFSPQLTTLRRSRVSRQGQIGRALYSRVASVLNDCWMASVAYDDYRSSHERLMEKIGSWLDQTALSARTRFALENPGAQFRASVIDRSTTELRERRTFILQCLALVATISTFLVVNFVLR